jgi:hypothetical protein
MRSMQWQLGILGAISAFASRQETKKTRVEGPSGCILTTSSQQSGKQKMRIP